MTLRVRKEGNSLYPEKAIIVGPLAEILLVTPTEGTVAEPTDAAATLRYSTLKGWQGFYADPTTQATTLPGAVVATGDTGAQGGFVGTFEDLSAISAAKPSPTPGDFATLRKGGMAWWNADTSTWDLVSPTTPLAPE